MDGAAAGADHPGAGTAGAHEAAGTGRALGKPALTARAPLVFAAAAIAVLAWPFGTGLGALTMASAVAVLLATDWSLAPRPGRIGVTRRIPSTLSLGTVGTVAWTVSNPLHRPVSVRLADELAPSLGASARRAALKVPAGRSVTARATLVPARRGHFSPAELVVRVEGPLRLMARQGARQVPAEVRVYPSFGSRRQADLRIERARILEVGLRSARSRGGGTEFEQLREYGVDDDSRRIDWAATARAARPIVRTYRSERNQRVLCLVDNGRTMAGQVAGVARVEHAIDAVMMLTSVAARVGDMPGLVAFDQELRAVVPPASGPSQLARVTDGLYDLVPSLGPSDYRGAFTAVLARFQRRAMLCLLTELDEALVDGLLPSLPLIARTHLLVVAAVRDPDVVRWATGAPVDIDEAYRTAAALSALRRRRELAAMLHTRGATVLDTSPARLGAALTDSYLQVKAAGRL